MAVGGPYLLTFLVALTGACLAWLILGSTGGAIAGRAVTSRAVASRGACAAGPLRWPA